MNKELLDHATKLVGSEDDEWNEFRRVSNILLKLRMERGLVTSMDEDKRVENLIKQYIERVDILSGWTDEEGNAEDEKAGDDIEMKDEKQERKDNNEEIGEQIKYEIEKNKGKDYEEDSITESMNEGYISQGESDFSTASGKRIMVRSAEEREYVNKTKRAKTQNDKKSTLKEAMEKQKVSGKKKLEIRVRFQFTYKGGRNIKRHYGEQIKEILYGMMMMMKRFNPEMQLMTWGTKNMSKDLSGEEIKLLSNEQILDYIDLNTTEEVLKNGKKYFMNGLRLKTYDDVKTVMKKWDIEKYKLKDGENILKTITFKEAEMQKSDEAIAIGYMMGTTEKGDYTTLNNKIEQITGVQTEVSYQMVNQHGISKKIWQLAKEKAEKKYSNPYSKEHRRLKFQYSPNALVVYVAREEDIELATEKLFEEYGNLIEGQWATVPDGSRMRFVPIIQGTIATESVVKYLHESLYIQAVLKANEIVFELPLKDIYAKKEYLDNMSLEEVIHSITTDDEENVPVFKHITRKWTRDPEETKYEVVCQPKMKEDAQEILRNLQARLEELFDHNVRKHFLAPLQMIKVKRKLETKKGVNKKLESMIMASQGDSYGNMLIEGMEIMDKEPKMELRQTKREVRSRDEDSDDTLSNTSTISNSTTKTIQFSKSAEEGNELTTESCIQSMREQAAKYNITSTEAIEWVREYHEDNDSLLKAEDLDDIIEVIGLGAWKEMKTGIIYKRRLKVIKSKAERRKKKEKGKSETKENMDYNKPEPELDEALSKMDIDIPKAIQHNEHSVSSETNYTSQVSRLTNEEPSQGTRDTAGEGGGR